MGRETIETDPETTQIIELLDKDLKIIINTVFHIFKKLEERLNMLHRDMEDIHMIQISLLEKNTIASEIKKKKKNTWGGECLGGSVG